MLDTDSGNDVDAAIAHTYLLKQGITIVNGRSDYLYRCRKKVPFGTFWGYYILRMTNRFVYKERLITHC